jgi:hypothetical protein
MSESPKRAGTEAGRPRDELGRPLPWGVPNRLESLPLEKVESLPTPFLHRLALEEFVRGRFFQAHELWEVAWKRERPSPLGEALRGLSQIAAGCVHLARGNFRGAAALLQRGASRLEVRVGTLAPEEEPAPGLASSDPTSSSS